MQQVQNNNSSGNQQRIYRPTFTQDSKKMTVKYYDGSTWKTTVFSNDEDEDRIAQHLTKFFNKNVSSKNNGSISSGDMLLAWMQAKSKNTPVRHFLSRNKYTTSSSIINIGMMDELDKMIQTACQENSNGGTDVTQKEQFCIMDALANWFRDDD